jgi:glycosyltransferase involved in cell wall biosynthesis
VTASMASGTQPLVSVVVTCHNYGAFLPEALESVLGQTYPNVEIIVVDDGSTDDTRAVTKPFLDRGVRYLHQENRGPGPARNAGVAATSGPLVGFLDADDAWLPNKLSLQVAYFERHPELGLVSGAYFQGDEDNNAVGLVPAPRLGSGYVFERLLVRNELHNPTVVLVRRSCLEEVGGFSDIAPPVEDWDTWIEVAQRFPIGAVSEPVARRRRHARTISRRASGTDWIESQRRILVRHLDHVEPAWKRRLVRRRAEATAHFFAAVSTSRDSRRRAALLVLRSLWLDPVTAARRRTAFLARVALPSGTLRLLRGLAGRSREP